MTLFDYFILFAVGGVGSAINAVAGGGTFIAFPVLIFLGLSPVQANVACTIALWPGSVASALAYRREWLKQKETLPMLMAISAIGSAAGAYVLLATPEQQFKALIPWLMLAATLIFTFGRKILSHVQALQTPIAARTLQIAIAFYGGYFGAGIGILMLAMLQLLGLHDIHRMNALKTVLGSTINAVAVVIFVISGAVVWVPALAMLAGAVIGGYASAHLAQKVPPHRVRLIISVIGFAMTAWFFVG